MSFSHEVRGSLAKCLAQENIIVEHKKVSTAMFDVDKRILTLPLWDRASDQVYQMLVLHEVSHAIWTDNIDWTVEYSDVPKDFINVLEDVRVEKLCKKKYPGSSKHFFNGYNELNDQDFFLVKDKNLNNLSFIDRINLYFKIGAFHNIAFNDDENEFLTRISKIETFQEVLDLARDIFIFANEKKLQPLKIPPIHQNSTNDNTKGQFEEESEAENNETSQKESEKESDDNSRRESNDGVLNTDQTVSNDKSGNEPSNQHNHDNNNELTSETSKSFEDKTKSLTDMSASETHYVEIPKMNDQMIIPNEFIHKKIKQFYTISLNTEYYNFACKSYISYKKSAEKEVSYLVKEFECKKSADQYARSTISKTGILDTQKLHTYKFNEDLFKKVSVIPDGKNHGLIFIFDWSSSMSEIILDAYKQLLNLIWFCRKVNIPFEVYAFTSNYNSYLELQPNHPQTYEKVAGVLALEQSFRLMNYFTSKTNSRVLDEQLKNIWAVCYSIQHKSASYPPFIDTSGSPIGESIISLHYLIPDFQEKYKLQKVNVVFLTDGEGYLNSFTIQRKKPYGESYIGFKRNFPFSIRDKKTGRIYSSINSDHFPKYSKVLLQTVKDKFPTVNLINFRITSSRHFLECYTWYGHESVENEMPKYEKLRSLFTKNGCVQFNETGFDQFNVVISSSLSQDEEFSVPENATKAQIKSKFIKMLGKKKTNKKLLSSFIGLVA